MTTDSGNTICAGIIKELTFRLRSSMWVDLAIHHHQCTLHWPPACASASLKSNHPSDSDDCSTGTPGPIVEDTEIFFR